MLAVNQTDVCAAARAWFSYSRVTPGIPGEKPVRIELSDFKTREVVDVMEVDACLVATGRAPYTEGLNLEGAIKVETQRGFVPVNESMQVLDKDGAVVEGVWCIGDANGKMMLAHAASAQGIAAIECMQGREQVLNHNSVPAACFTHPEVREETEGFFRGTPSITFPRLKLFVLFFYPQNHLTTRLIVVVVFSFLRIMFRCC